jgi:hypothetical protein
MSEKLIMETLGSQISCSLVILPKIGVLVNSTRILYSVHSTHITWVYVDLVQCTEHVVLV